MRMCEHCGKPLKRVVWLEMSTRTGLYYKPGEVPPEESQGLFAFGEDCAKKVLK